MKLSKDEVARDNRIFWGVNVINFLFPLLEGITVIVLNLRVQSDNTDHLRWDIVLLNVSEYCVGITQIGSGTLFIYAMIKIR